jgi:hypothetical protein
MSAPAAPEADAGTMAVSIMAVSIMAASIKAGGTQKPGGGSC